MKIYKVCEYKTKTEVFRGSAKQCADFLKMKNSSQFHSFVHNIASGIGSGKQLGYTAYLIAEDTLETIEKRNLEILQAFYQEYWRSPRKTEFVACGGNLAYLTRYKIDYADYLTERGYDIASKYETLEVVDQNGDVVFTGTSADIYEEYNIKPNFIPSYTSRDKTFEDDYGNVLKFRKKPFTGLKGYRVHKEP